MNRYSTMRSHGSTSLLRRRTRTYGNPTGYLSMGYALYDYKCKLDADAFLKQLDSMLYAQKREKKDLRPDIDT